MKPQFKLLNNGIKGEMQIIQVFDLIKGEEKTYTFPATDPVSVMEFMYRLNNGGSYEF